MRRARTILVALLALLYVAGIPGTVAHRVLLELTAPELPKDLEARDGALEVFVRSTEESGGGPIAGAQVRAFAILSGRAYVAGDGRTDEGGHVSVARLPAAEHWIVAEAGGRARASQMVVVVSGTRRVDLELGPEHALDVTVKDEKGAPIDGAEIEVRGSDPFPVGGRTDERGEARVGRLGNAPYVVSARAPGYEEITKRHVPEGARVVITLSKQGALLVRVVEASGQGAAGARVLLAGASLGPPRVAVTGDDGSVRIGGLDTGAYTLRAVHDTRVSPIEIGVPVSRGEEKNVELRLEAGVMIVARVVDAVTDEAVRGARTTLAEGGLSPFPLEGVTDKSGRVTLGPIARGPASLSARADDYVPKAPVRIDDPAPPEVTVALVRGGTLVGKIQDARGYAVDGATIRIVGTDLEGMPIDEDPQRTSFREAHFSATIAGPSPLVPAGELGVMPGPVPPIPHGRSGWSALGLLSSPAAGDESGEGWVSGRDGAFEATPVTPGRVRALVRHPQYVEAMSQVVTLAPGKEARVQVVLLRGGTLEGKVVDERGRGVGGATVTVLATKGSLERMTRTGTDGSFAFASVPDALTVLVSRDDDPSTVAARAEVSVPDGGTGKIEITLPEPRPALDVKITTREHGTGVEGAQVSAVSLDDSESLRVTAFTDARGEAQLAGAKGLALRVEVHAPDRAVRVVSTSAGDKGPLVVVLGNAESVTGEVSGGRRDPIEGAEITLHTETGIRHARADKDGAFTIGELSPGPARIRVRAKGRAPAFRDVVIEQKDGRRPTEVPRFELPEEGVVEGVVVDSHGDPVPGARVAKDSVPTYLPASGPLVGMARADDKGRFVLGELASGMIALEAYAPDVGRARVTDVRVSAGRTTDGVKIVLSREGASSEPIATGGVAITLGETTPGAEGPEVVVVAVSENSEAERAGLLAHDVVLEIGGRRPKSIVDARARLSGPVHDDVVVKVRRGDRVVSLRVAREKVRR